jgi:hypothetical protein
MHPTEETQTGISFIPIGKNWGQQPSRMVIGSATPPKIASLHTPAAVSIVCPNGDIWVRRLSGTLEAGRRRYVDPLRDLSRFQDRRSRDQRVHRNPATFVTPTIRYPGAKLAHDQRRATGSDGAALQPEAEERRRGKGRSLHWSIFQQKPVRRRGWAPVYARENATKQRDRAPFRFNRNGKGSGARPIRRLQ